MIVYRITLAVFAHSLVASGNPARWNSKDIKVIYTAESRSLACLENIVHRNSNGLSNEFRVLIIDIPDSLKISVINRTDLPEGWQSYERIPYTQSLGDQWIKELNSAILKVPSVIIPGECNYLLNPAHKDYPKIKYVRSESFEFDSRI